MFGKSWDNLEDFKGIFWRLRSPIAGERTLWPLSVSLKRKTRTNTHTLTPKPNPNPLIDNINHPAPFPNHDRPLTTTHHFVLFFYCSDVHLLGSDLLNVGVCVRVLHGALEGRHFFRIPVSEWLQPENDHEVPGSAREVSCNLRHGEELHGSQDRPGH